MSDTSSASNCSICGRPLTDEKSIAFGMGAICRAGMGLKKFKLPKGAEDKADTDRTPDFSYQIIDGVVLINDRDRGNQSVTNGAETVIRRIISETRGSLDGFLWVYRDSTGQWDGLDVRSGSFRGFYFGGKTSEEAIAKGLLRKAA